MHLTDKLKYHVYRLRNRRSNRAFRQAHPDVALPPDYMMFESFRLDYERYYRSGRDTAQFISGKLGQFIELKDLRILDWGCGPARVIRHMPEVIGNGCYFYGTDYNADTIAWCSRHIPGVDFRLNLLSPPLPFEKDYFQAIYGISVFTHLSEEKHYSWFEELMRVSSPGAILLLTMHGAAFTARMSPGEVKRFEAGHLVTRENVVEGHRVFAAFHPPSFVHTLTGKHCEVLEHRPGGPTAWGIDQDLWILRKK